MGSKKNKGNNGPEKHSLEYREKRIKNNVAVKRSRDKSKAKAHDAQVRVQHLQNQNEQLQSTVDAMTSELRYLKEMLISQAGTSEFLSADTAADLEDLLQENAPRDLGKLTSVLNEVKKIQGMHKGGLGDMGGHNSHIYASNSNSGSGSVYNQQHIQENHMYHPNGAAYDTNYM